MIREVGVQVKDVLARQNPGYLAGHYPSNLVVELTTKCNLACSYCARQKIVVDEKVSIEDIRPEVLDDICTRFVHMPPKILSFSGLGEPLLCSNIRVVLKWFRAMFNKSRLMLNTNGLLIREHLDVIRTSVDEVFVSLNAVDRDTYKILNGVDKYNLVAENILSLTEKSSKQMVVVSLLDVDANRPLLKRAVKQWKQYANVSVGTLDNHRGRIHVEDFVKDYTVPKRRFPCYGLWSNMSVTTEGDYYACCGARWSGVKADTWLGNMGSSKAEMEKRLKGIRSLHLQGRYGHPCLECDGWVNMGNHFGRGAK